MDNRLMRGLVACALLIGSGLSTHLFASSTHAVTINYGIVASIGTVQKDSKHAGGALAGGMIGALIEPRRHRGLRMVAGAAAGAATQGAPVARCSSTWSTC